MPVTSTWAGVRVTVTPVIVEEEETHHVDGEAEHRDEDERVAGDLGRLEQPLDRLDEDEVPDEEEEHGVGVARDDLVATVAVGVQLVRLQLRDERSVQTDTERRAVELDKWETNERVNMSN